VRKLFWLILTLGLCGGFAAVTRADTFQLTDGTSVSGDIVLFNEAGITLRTTSGSYTNIVWPKLSQDSLKQLAQNPKIKPLAEAFIETPPARPRNTEIHIQDVTRTALPPKESLLAALLSSSVGFVALFLIYGANVYAGYEIAIVRGRPIGLVMVVSAVLPILGPIIFLCLPEPREPAPAEAPSQLEQHAFTVPGEAPAAGGPATAGIQVAGVAARAPGHPEAQVFQRGQFMFNRRFFETKFAGFFSVVRRPAERDLVLVIKAGRTNLVAQRITRIATNEAYFEVVQGGGRQEVMVPFADIQEIQLKHKDA